VSLYNVQKLLFQLNRDPAIRKRFDTEFDSLLADYELTEEEQIALRAALREGCQRADPDALRGAARLRMECLHRGDARGRAQARTGAHGLVYARRG
jgi:hypothetical protein